MSRRVVLAVVTAVAVAAAALGWVAGRQIQSPADAAAEAAPPPASLITVPIETISLSSSVITRGDVVFADSLSLRVGPSTDGSSIVTRMPWEVGDTLTEGDVIVEVGGRPVFALQGDLPVFRSFGPSVNGPDVEQLEAALSRLGLDPGPIDGTYTTETQAAIETLYRDAGYTPNLPSVDELDRLDLAEDAVEQSRRSLRDLRAQGSALPESQRLQLQGEIDAAVRALEESTIARSEVVDPLWAETAAAQEVLAGAQTALDTATQRRVTGDGGTDPDTGEPITASSMTALAEAEAAAIVARDAAQASVDEAAAAEAAAKREHDGYVADAENRLAVARASLAEAQNPETGVNQAEQIQDAEAALVDAQESLARVQAQIGTTFPASELLFLPFLPREVQQVNVRAGEIPQDSVMTVTGSGARIDGSVSAADRPLVSVGQRAVLDNESLGLQFDAEVTEIADEASGGAGRFRVRFEPIDVVPVDAYYQNFRVTIPIDTTGGDVLAVPLAALSASADGSARVEVEAGDGTTRIVTVVPGLRAQGFVQITPVDDELAEGDRVVVGRTGGQAGGDADITDADDDITDADDDEGS